MNLPPLNRCLSESRTVPGRVIDVFEDFLEEKNVFIPNPEREDDEDLENGAIIYGSDYDSVSSGIESELSAGGLL